MPIHGCGIDGANASLLRPAEAVRFIIESDVYVKMTERL